MYYSHYSDACRFNLLLCNLQFPILSNLSGGKRRVTAKDHSSTRLQDKGKTKDKTIRHLRDTVKSQGEEIRQLKEKVATSSKCITQLTAGWNTTISVAFEAAGEL